MRASKLIGLLVVLAALPALADDVIDQAKRDVGAGLAAQSAGHYDEAIALYRRAYEAIPHPEILFNLGQAYRLKGDAETALGYYRRYVAAEPKGRAASDAERWIDELGKVIAARKRPPERKPDDAHKADAHRTEVDRKPGGARKVNEVQDEVRKVQGPPGEVSGAAPSPAGPPVGAASNPAAASPVAGSGATGVAASVQPAGGSARSTYQPCTWISAAGGAGALIGGLLVGDLARSKRNDATAICGADHLCDSDSDTRRANALLAQSRTRGTISTTLVVIGAAGLATSGVLWWLGRRAGATQTAIAPIAGPTTLGLAVGGAF